MTRARRRSAAAWACALALVAAFAMPPEWSAWTFWTPVALACACGFAWALLPPPETG